MILDATANNMLQIRKSDKESKSFLPFSIIAVNFFPNCMVACHTSLVWSPDKIDPKRAGCKTTRGAPWLRRIVFFYQWPWFIKPNYRGGADNRRNWRTFTFVIATHEKNAKHEKLRWWISCHQSFQALCCDLGSWKPRVQTVSRN